MEMMSATLAVVTTAIPVEPASVDHAKHGDRGDDEARCAKHSC